MKKSGMTEKQIRKYSKIAHETYQRDVVERALAFFTDAMRTELMRHLDRPGWEDEPLEFLWRRLFEELGELKAEIANGKPRAVIVKECADVANFLMMIADTYEEG